MVEKPENSSQISKEFNQIISPRIFKIYYTSEVLSDCIKEKYEWYLKIIADEKRRIDTFFKDISGH